MHNACMSHKMKFHLLAVVLIALIVSVIHSMTEPEVLPPRIVTVVQYSPIIVSATWGRNCNQQIEQAKLYTPPVARPVVPDASAPKPLALVERNNVLETVKTLCANQETCTFTANTGTLGEILPSCANQLELSYYCTEAERVRTVKSQQDNEVVLDCSRVRR